MALVLGLVGIIGWWGEFVDLLKGAVPVVLLLGGGLAAYLGAEDLKAQRAAELEAAQAPFQGAGDPDAELEKYKAEVAELRAKLEAMDKVEPPAPPADEEQK
ncbi:conserved hypothetical protein [Desulfarculus baarsii DSM 2075]|uniref:Uncharacterized protein n=1 Tax=Desulfarculus baarsii (strain ATCC 33931 / DSM 2075 / LMG 7858 / VKM B-1802 / 2st14) TaxID=644282 RepID=E1QLR9_DESB2|nr:conserved hypothetical protein [Desulfarculus baarsii DSM 2075]